MKTIVVPTDFSVVATNAMNYAVEMAMEIDASIFLLHVYQIPVAISEVPVATISVEEMKRISEDKMAELKSAVEHISSHKIKVYAESRLGDVIDELESLCKKIQPFAVVMGTKGAGAVERLFLGSTTLTAIRHLTSPVIVVPPGAIYKGIKKIGFACDFNEVVKTTPVDEIRKMVSTFGAGLHILNVDYKNRHFKPETPEESLLIHTMLQAEKPEFHFIEDPDVEDGINKFAEKNNLDLIITIPKKHKLLEGIFKPSSTRQLVFQSHIPIMCVHEA